MSTVAGENGSRASTTLEIALNSTSNMRSSMFLHCRACAHGLGAQITSRVFRQVESPVLRDEFLREKGSPCYPQSITLCGPLPLKRNRGLRSRDYSSIVISIRDRRRLRGRSFSTNTAATTARAKAVQISAISLDPVVNLGGLR